ncbi:MAG: flavin reductase family protein [Methanoregula sp.]|jgi:flavin reductase (DIM6/NTAB) family NADH-FMN oxidoreductase RutF
MEKVSIGTNATMSPLPITLIGSMVGGRPNFMNVAFISLVCWDPPLISMGLNQRSATREAVLESREFSVNYPSAPMVTATDYCGIVSAKNKDKSGVFKTFHGTLTGAPMITECPLSFECKVIEVHDFKSHTCFISEIVASHLDKSCMTDGKPDYQKINPLLLTMPDNHYWTLGKTVGRAWSIGKDMKE